MKKKLFAEADTNLHIMIISYFYRNHVKIIIKKTKSHTLSQKLNYCKRQMNRRKEK